MYERNINRLPLACPQPGGLAHTPSMCTNLESNRRPFALWEDIQLTELQWSGPPQFSLPVRRLTLCVACHCHRQV